MNTPGSKCRQNAGKILSEFCQLLKEKRQRRCLMHIRETLSWIETSNKLINIWIRYWTPVVLDPSLLGLLTRAYSISCLFYKLGLDFYRSVFHFVYNYRVAKGSPNLHFEEEIHFICMIFDHSEFKEISFQATFFINSKLQGSQKWTHIISN